MERKEMSGVDEQVKDFPRCTKCKYHSFWIGRRNHSRIRDDDIFFNPLSFRGDGGRPVPVYDNDVARVAREEELQEIIEIRCDGCQKAVDEVTFDKILRTARYLIREWRSKNVRDR